MTECKRCGSTKIVKNGTVRGKQRYLCKQCGCHFVEGDQREKRPTSKAVCELLAAMGVKPSDIAYYMRRDKAQISRWLKDSGIKNSKERIFAYVSRFSPFELAVQIECGDPNEDVLVASGTLGDADVTLLIQRLNR